MSTQTPYAQLVGTWKFWVGAASLAAPAIDAAPSGDWTELGSTDGDQSFTFVGGLTPFTDNDHHGAMKHVRPNAGFTIGASLVDLTLEKWVRALGMASSLVTTGVSSGSETAAKMPLLRPYVPERFAILARGGAVEATNTMSAYGASPAQIWVPQVVVDGDAAVNFGKSTRGAVPFVFKAEIDVSQAAGEEFGYILMQTS